MRRSRARRNVLLSMAASMSLVTALATPADAETWYWYKPGHEMNFSASDSGCTGAWAIKGGSGTFFLSAGHCSREVPESYHESVWGASARFGAVRRNEWFRNRDRLLVQPDSGVGSQQEVRGTRVYGKLRNGYLTGHTNAIGMYGRTTGYASGHTMGGWYRHPVTGERNACAWMRSRGGDSGGPVYVTYGSKAYAAGIILWGGENSAGRHYTCFSTIDDNLSTFGGYLPVYKSATANDMEELAASDDDSTDQTLQRPPGTWELY